jgi:hypothetical protein
MKLDLDARVQREEHVRDDEGAAGTDVVHPSRHNQSPSDREPDGQIHRPALAPAVLHDASASNCSLRPRACTHLRVKENA